MSSHTEILADETLPIYFDNDSRRKLKKLANVDTDDIPNNFETIVEIIENFLLNKNKYDEIKIIFTDFLEKNNSENNFSLLWNLIILEKDNLASLIVQIILDNYNSKTNGTIMINFAVVIYHSIATKYNYTIFFLACKKNMPKTALKLIELGMKSRSSMNDQYFIYPDFHDGNGITALDWCEKNRMREVETELEILNNEKKKGKSWFNSLLGTRKEKHYSIHDFYKNKNYELNTRFTSTGENPMPNT
jgi:hypothetical protein